MPSFDDIMGAVDLLQVSPVILDDQICVRATNRNSNCDKCSRACIAQAFELSRGAIEIDASKCVNCGCCVPVCPSGALNMAEPSAKAVMARALKVADMPSRSVAIACARAASKNVADSDKFLEVPCLGHIGEIQLMEMASSGLDDIILVDGDCSTCKLGAASERINETLYCAEDLLDACGSEAIISRMSEFPEEYISEETSTRGEGRRGLLMQTTSYVKTVAGNVAKTMIDEKLQEAGIAKEDSSPRRGAMRFEPTLNYALIESMENLIGKELDVEGSSGCPSSSKGVDDAAVNLSEDAVADLPENATLNLPEHAAVNLAGDEISTRHFGSMHIDVERCSGCGMCVLFCPTEALKYNDFDSTGNDETRYCDFRSSDCTQCMLCKDVCLRECLEVSPDVRLSEVLDLEPELVEIAKPKQTSSFSGLLKRNR